MNYELFFSFVRSSCLTLHFHFNAGNQPLYRSLVYPYVCAVHACVCMCYEFLSGFKKIVMGRRKRKNEKKFAVHIFSRRRRRYVFFSFFYSSLRTHLARMSFDSEAHSNTFSIRKNAYIYTRTNSNKSLKKKIWNN